MGKHHSRPHNNSRMAAVSAHQVLSQYIKKTDVENEKIRMDYQSQLEEKAANDWIMNLAVSCLVYFEKTGSRQKTQDFAQRLADALRDIRDKGQSIEEVLEELRRRTDIDLEVQG